MASDTEAKYWWVPVVRDAGGLTILAMTIGLLAWIGDRYLDRHLNQLDQHLTQQEKIWDDVLEFTKLSVEQERISRDALRQTIDRMLEEMTKRMTVHAQQIATLDDRIDKIEGKTK